ncbi:MAG: hypothetical protein ABIH66_00695 [bacterium]
MKSIKVKCVITTISLLFLVAATSATAAAAEKKNVYTIAIPMIKGLEETKIVDMFGKMGTVLGKKMGCEFKVEPLPYEYNQRKDELVIKWFNEGKADIAYISGIELSEYQKKGRRGLVPLFILGMEKSAIKGVCFYTRKGEFSKVSELRGKTWFGGQPVVARLLLYKNDIDEPIDKFFGAVGFETESPIFPLVEKLKKKEIDVFSCYKSTMMLSGELAKKDSVIKPLSCAGYESNWVFVARADMPPGHMQQFRSLMLGAHKDPDFAQFGFFFQTARGHFMPLDKETQEFNDAQADLIKKQGWRKEEEAFYKKYHVGYEYKFEHELK